jgi:hypothetical protein
VYLCGEKKRSRKVSAIAAGRSKSLHFMQHAASTARSTTRMQTVLRREGRAYASDVVLVD